MAPVESALPSSGILVTSIWRVPLPATQLSIGTRLPQTGHLAASLICGSICSPRRVREQRAEPLDSGGVQGRVAIALLDIVRTSGLRDCLPRQHLESSMATGAGAAGLIEQGQSSSPRRGSPHDMDVDLRRDRCIFTRYRELRSE